MELKLSGKIKLINDTQTWDSGFSKREFVITTDEQYPQDVKFEVIKDKTSLLDNFTVGDNVDVSFNVRGNEYQGRYFVNLQAWRINKINDGATPPANMPPLPTEEPDVMPQNDETDDLPF
ncbi:MAG TPA: hypothetical protein DIU39_02255 [Flavobacteriales bacterium]|nr:hypothetical protein [Flavobacteriales bacterium]|tara:strand:+ start:1264 stop:1623 length:360 start_codon:yes stop_codon:yes gene_type:complete